MAFCGSSPPWQTRTGPRVVAALARERNYVSQLARELDISRALLQVHLRKLEAAGLVSATIESHQTGRL